MGQPCTYFHFWVNYPFKSSTLHCGTERISAVSFLNTTHLSWLHKQKCTHFESSSASLLASSTSFPLKMNWECAPYITGPFPCHMCTPWFESLFVGGGEILLDQWYVHNEVILCFVLYLFSRDLSVCQERLSCSLCGVTLTTLFWHSSGVARFLSSIHAPVCRVDKASQVSLDQHRHLTVSRFTPHRRLLRSRVIGLLTQTMRVNKTQRCFRLWEIYFL